MAGAPGSNVHLVEQQPVAISRLDDGVVLLDFGRVAFGNLRVTWPEQPASEVVVHFGEALAAGRIDRNPPGAVRYAAVVARSGMAGFANVVSPPVNKLHLRPAAIRTDASLGVLLPFRWVEIEGWPGDAASAAGHFTRLAAFARDWDDNAAHFECADSLLNAIWELCRYSIKATTFAGVYVDGDRERVPYEADAYLTQISHYACDPDPSMARLTFDHLMRAPTWPTEWAPHMIFMAHADWMQTGDRGWLADRYEALKSKLLLDRARSDGLVTSDERQIARVDIVDWPKGERDGFAFSGVNSVVNAFHHRSLALMAELAEAVGAADDAAGYTSRCQAIRARFHTVFFDRTRGVYRDDEDVEHASQHANLFALAFGLTPAAHRTSVLEFLVQKGMACSVYAAQYLLQALFENGADQAALALMGAPGDRSWRHMIEQGATITWEAWDQRYKPNLDWNHAWGAAPANLLPRYVAGARAIAPGWRRAQIKPHPGGLTACRAKIPTPHGPLFVDWRRGLDFDLRFTAPAGVGTELSLPLVAEPVVRVDGREVAFRILAGRIEVDGTWEGSHHVVVETGSQ